MPAKQQQMDLRERETVQRIVAEVHYEEDQAEAERVARADAQAAEEARRVERQREAREAADAWVGACGEIVDGMDQLVAGLHQQDAAGARLLLAQVGATVCVGKPAARRRFGDYLARRLFSVVRSNHVGRIKLNGGGNSAVGDFVGAEHVILDRLLNPPDEESEHSNGELTADEIEPKPGQG